MSNNSELPPLQTSVGIGLLTTLEKPADEELLDMFAQDTDAALIRALLIKGDELHKEGIDPQKALFIGFALRDRIQKLTEAIEPLRPEELLLPLEPEA